MGVYLHQILAQLFQGGKAGRMRAVEPLGVGVLTCVSYRLASVFAHRLPTLGEISTVRRACACARACARR